MQQLYIDFLNNLRKVELQYVTLEYCEDITPHLKRFVQLLLNVKYEEKTLHCFYSEIKSIVTGFTKYWTEAMYSVDTLEESIFTVEDTVNLFDKTLDVVKIKYMAFKNEFIDQANPKSEELATQYDKYVKKLLNMKENVDQLFKSYDKSFLLPSFMLDHVKTHKTKTRRLLDCTHTAIALKIIEYEYEIKMSLEEMISKTNRNILDLEEIVLTTKKNTIQRLYEKNKELLIVWRKCKNSTERDNIDKEIERYILQIISEPHEIKAIEKLKPELKFWQDKHEEFKFLMNNVHKIKKEINKIDEKIDVCNKVRGPNYKSKFKCCYENVNISFLKNRKYIKDQYVHAVKTLVTYFSVRGVDQAYYTDDLGTYYKDPFGHQVYVSDYGMIEYHKSCDGKLVQRPDKEKMYEDEHGSYCKTDKGEKIYKVGHCCSSYKLNEEGTFQKISEDCGHELGDKACKIDEEKKKFVVLPKEIIYNKNKSLNRDDVNYLWQMAGVISMSLRDVATLQPTNPIHYFAHRLLENKLVHLNAQKEQEEAKRFRENIYKERKEHIQIERKIWASKQVQRRPIEEFDDAQAQREYYDYLVQMNYMEC